MTSTRRVIDVQEFIDSRPFSPFQCMILVLCFLVAATDGFDTASIGFIAPSLVEHWGISRASLGPVMSAGLLGLGLGALIAGPCTDRIGRKTVLVISVFFFGIWSLASSRAGTIESLIIMRFFTGLGLGAAMPNAVTLMSEYAPARVRSVTVNAMICGFSCGLALGGIASAWLIPHFGWPGVLVAGGVGPITLSALLLLLLPESAQFLAVRKRADRRIELILKRIAPRSRIDGCRFITRDAHGDIAVASDGRVGQTVKGRFALELVFSSGYRLGTVMLWVTYFMGLMIYYLLANWLPTLLNDAGFSGKQASLTTSLFPVGGIVGNLCLGWVMDRFAGHKVIGLAFILVGGLVLLVGQTIDHQAWVGALIFVVGGLVSGAITSTMAFAANFYPAVARGTGVALMIGIGRAGGVAGAMVGAALMSVGWQFGAVFGLLAVPAGFGAVSVYLTMWRRASTLIHEQPASGGAS